MAIERSLEGLIALQFDLADQLVEDENMTVEKRILLASKVVGGVRGLGALKLAHMRESARAPEFAARNQPMKLVNGSDKVKEPKEPNEDL